jgi:CDP-6-deoxy-D-xylo-4-hexulose-3-dehydrase
MQAACGLAQLDRLDGFISKRKKNFNYLYESLKELSEFLILPEKEKNSDPSWFGFPLTIRDENKFDRAKLMQFLSEHNIGSRLLFAGNVTKQPYMKNINYRISSTLEKSEIVMKNTFWIGLYPGLSNKHLDFSSEKIKEFFKK